MVGPPPAVAAVRVAVRAHLRHAVAETSAAHDHDGGSATDVPLVLAACSGGADSLALAAALAFEAPRAGVRAGAVVVDHGLQADSERVAARAGQACADLGLDPVEVVRVRVATGRGEAGAAPAGDVAGALGPHTPADGGPEARARRARYEAFYAAAARTGARAILLGHTLDDQAEQVLLGLARGSGARSLAGMPRVRGLVRRPLLGLTRATTVAACEAQGLSPWHDPHNLDPRYRRVRARALLREVEDELGPGVVAALARTADLLRDDADALDAAADEALAGLGAPPWAAADLGRFPRAVRTRLWLRFARRADVPPGRLTSRHVDALDALVTSWHGQGPVVLPGEVRVWRAAGAVHADAPPSG